MSCKGACRAQRLMLAAGAANPQLAQPAPRVTPTLRPSFTVILWGCSMPLWPRIFQHIQSNVDGDVSVAKKRLPAEVLPFLEAVCALLLRPHSAHQSSQSLFKPRRKTQTGQASPISHPLAPLSAHRAPSPRLQTPSTLTCLDPQRTIQIGWRRSYAMAMLRTRPSLWRLPSALDQPCS